MGVSPSFLIYSLIGPTRARPGLRGTFETRAARPPGQMVWFHVEDRADLPVVFDLMAYLQDDSPDLSILLTGNEELPADIPDQCISQPLPPDARRATEDFLAHWRPDVSVWITGTLRPVMIHQAAERGIPLILLDTGAAIKTTQGRRILRGLNRKTLRKFDKILSGDEATSLALISAGARRKNVVTAGVLELESKALPCNLTEWEALTALLATRPIWLAAEVVVDELKSVLAAHGQALRRSHRLLLIVVPANPDDGDEFADILTENQMSFARRSIAEEPETDTQIYLADTEDEMGLWYRLAPVTFVGQTLVGRKKPGPDPFNAATLGSVVLHGPLIMAHQVAYQRLARAGASREISHMGELAHALETLLAPDRAAVMAHAAWQISSAGAEVMEHAIGTITEQLEATAGTEE